MIGPMKRFLNSNDGYDFRIDWYDSMCDYEANFNLRWLNFFWLRNCSY